MKSILVPLSGSVSDAHALAAAYLVARRFEGRIEALAVHPDAMQIATVAAVQQFGTRDHSAEALHTLEKRADNAATAAFAAFDAFLKSQPANEMVKASLRRLEGEPVRDTTMAARFHDLVVMARAEKGTPLAIDAVASILNACGRPLLLVPETPLVSLGGTVAIAWKETAEAARAVTAAQPLLERAGRIVVIGAAEAGTEGDIADSLERLAATLRLNGLPVDTLAVAAGASASESLLNAARDVRADLLVMGAYGHGRLHELVFGGFTRALLEACDLPLFLQH